MSGYFTNTTSYNMPWMQNSMPTFTPSFTPNFTPSWDWSGSSSIYGWGNSSSSSSGSSSNLSFEEYKEKEAEELEKKLKSTNKNTATTQLLKNGASMYTTMYTDEQSGACVEVYADKDGNPLKFKVDSNGQIALDSNGKPIKDSNGSVMPVSDLKSIEKAKKNLEKSKKEDGSATVSVTAEEYEKKVPWYKRALRAGGNMLQGTFKMAKSLVGYDENGKWNLVKCIKNVAVLAAGVALTAVCPAAGPVLLYAGLGLGAAQVGKGVYKACTAKTVEEIDNAWQDVGVGVATVIASKGGIKGMGKTAGVDTSGLKMVTNAGKLVKSQPKWIFANGFKGSGKSFTTNLKNLNPFKSQTKEKLNQAEHEYVQTNLGMNDSALSVAEKDALLDRAIQLEQEIANLKTARMNELCTSPTKWISKQNRKAVTEHTGKNLVKSYWDANTAGKTCLGKAWISKTMFVAGKATKGAMGAMAPDFILWDQIQSGSYMTTFMGTDMLAYKQNYEEGALNSLIAPESVQHLSAEEYDNQLASLTQQEKAIKDQLATLDKKNGSAA